MITIAQLRVVQCFTTFDASKVERKEKSKIYFQISTYDELSEPF